MHLRWPFMFVTVLVVAGTLGSMWMGGVFSASHEPEFYPEQIAEQKTIRDWLESQRQGLSGEEYWYYFRTPVRLSALKSYEIVDCPTKDDCAKKYTVRLHFGARRGPPIVELWEIEFGGMKMKIWSAKPVGGRDDQY